MIDRALGGVCGGLGTYLGINAWWVRVTFVVLALFTVGVSAVLYLVLWMVIPQQTIHELPTKADEGVQQVRAESLVLLGSGVVLFGVVVLAVSLGVLRGARGDVLLPFVILGLGLVLLAQQVRRPT